MAAGLALAIAVGHAAILEWMGSHMVVNEPLAPADVLAVTFDSREGGLIEIADLYHEGWARAVVVIEPSLNSMELELRRRGVRFSDPAVAALEQLGIPRASITALDSGDGGTTEGAQALTEWLGRGPMRRAIVVVSQTHGRRFGRTLRRGWPTGWPQPIVRTSRLGPFRPDGWWKTRTQLRDGLVELEKLALDYVSHPL